MVAEALAPERGFEPLPPHSSEAEQSVLGSLLIDVEAIEVAAQILTPTDFYHPRNRDIYAAMLELHEHGQPTDYVTVSDELERRDLFDRIGGQGYLASLFGVVPTAVHVEHYARIVYRCSVNRRGIS